MKCKYCNSDMEIIETGFDSGAEYSYYICTNENCDATCFVSERSDPQWEED